MNELKWHQRPVRMMRLDYFGDALSRIKDTDFDELARSKRDEWHANCEWIVGTPGMAPGLGYQITFNSPKFEKYPPLGDFDFVREYLPYAKKYGINLIAYMNMHWFAYDFADLHSDWEQKTADCASYGRQFPLYGSGSTFCVNSSWRDWAFELIREAMATGIDGVFLDGPIFFPGCCYCESCREQFSSEYKTDIPTVEDWSNPDWIRFVGFRSRSLARFLKDCRQAVRSVNPDGVVFLNAGSWQAGTWRFARSIDSVGDFEDFNGAEAFFHPGPHEQMLLPWAATAKYMTAGDKPAVVFSHHMLGSWHYIPLSKIEAELAIAQTAACGANPWFATVNYALEHSRKAAIEPINEMQSFLADHEEYYTSTQSCADIALLSSSQTSAYYVSRLAGFYGEAGSGREENLLVDMGSGDESVDWKKRKEICEATVDGSYLGYFLAMTRSHVPFDVVLDKNISLEKLAKYRVLILPNSACLSDSQIECIRQFVHNGGSVVAEFETGAYDETGQARDINPLLGLFGVGGIKSMMKPVSMEEYVRIKQTHPAIGKLAPGQLIARPTYSLKCVASHDTCVPSVFMNEVGGVYSPLKGESDNPALIASSYGMGRTVYMPSLVGDFYNKFKLPDYEDLIEGIISWAHVNPLMVETDCPPTVEIEPRWNAQKDKILIHLVNNTGDMQRPITQIITLHDLSIRLRCGSSKSVKALRAGIDLPSVYHDGIAEFTLPELGVYELIAVELG
ncbi:MAG: alpha-amylase family protein [Armatimonadota bacterium]